MINKITSRDNASVKRAKKLSSSPKEREKHGLFFIEGLRISLDALKSGVDIEEVFYTQKALDKWKDSVEMLVSDCRKSYLINDSIASFISDTQTPQGIFCVCKMLDKPLDLDKIGNKRFIIGLENIQDPSNMGTIIRTAEALAINTIILSKNCCDIYSPKVLRGSMGGVFRTSFVYVDSFKDAICRLNALGVNTYASVIDKDAKLITDLSFANGNKMVIIGNEGNGISKETISCCKERITIPMPGRAESLNASIAASIIMWEMVRNG